MPKMSRADTAKVMNAMHTLLEKKAPITGLSVGSLDDRATWEIQFGDEATEAQRKAATEMLAAFDVEQLRTAV